MKMTAKYIFFSSLIFIFSSFFTIDSSVHDKRSISNALSILSLSDDFMLGHEVDRNNNLPFTTISFAQTLDGSMY
jgi:hypothetical protein